MSRRTGCRRLRLNVGKGEAPVSRNVKKPVPTVAPGHQHVPHGLDVLKEAAKSTFRQITAADFNELRRLVEQARQEGKSKRWEIKHPFVYLDTPGGDVAAAMAVGRLLRKENAIPKGEISADKLREAFKSMLEELRAYFREMNVNEQLADAMLRIEPEHMHSLNYSEQNRYGLTMFDPITKEVEELTAVQSLGISRQEYMRRKAIAQTRCVAPTTFCAQKIIQTGKVDPTVSPDQDDPSQYGTPLKADH